MKKNYIQPQLEVIKISTIAMMAGSIPQTLAIPIEEEEEQGKDYGFEIAE